MNEKICAPAVLSNGEIKENGDIKKSASDKDCGVEDSLKMCIGNNDSIKGRDCLSDSSSNIHLNSVSSDDSPVPKESANISDNDSLSSKIISKQIDTCEPGAKGPDSQVEDSTVSIVENEEEDDFRLVLSPESSAAGISAEQVQEDSSEQSAKQSASTNISEDIEVKKLEEELTVGEKTEDSNLGNKSPAKGDLYNVNVGSDINNCDVTVDEGKTGGETKMVTENNSGSNVCEGEVLKKQSESEVLPSLQKETSADSSSKVTEGSDSQKTLITLIAGGETGDAEQSTNTDNCQETLNNLSCTTEESTKCINGVEPTLNDQEKNSEISKNENEISDQEKKAGEEEKNSEISKNENEISDQEKKAGEEEKNSEISRNENEISGQEKKAGEEEKSSEISKNKNEISGQEKKAEETRIIENDVTESNLEQVEKVGESIPQESKTQEAGAKETRSVEDAIVPDNNLEVPGKVDGDLSQEPKDINEVSKIVEDESMEEGALPSSPEGEKATPSPNDAEDKVEKEERKEVEVSSDSKTAADTCQKSDHKMSQNEEDENFLNSCEKEAKDNQAVDMEKEAADDQEVDMDKEAALLSSPKPSKIENWEEETEPLEDDVFVKSPEVKAQKDEKEMSKEMEDNLLSSPEKKNTVENLKDEKNVVTVKTEEKSCPNSPKSNSGPFLKEDDALPEKMDEDIVKPDPGCEMDVSVVNEDDNSKVKVESEASKSPASEIPVGDTHENSETSKGSDSIVAAVTPPQSAAVQLVESMDLDFEDSKDSSKEEVAVSSSLPEKKLQLTLELNGTARDGSEVKASIYCSNSSKGVVAAMPVSRKRAHSSVAGDQSSKPVDKSTKLARIVNGYDENSKENLGETKDFKKSLNAADSMETSECKSSEKSTEIKANDISTKMETDLKSKVKEADGIRMDLSYLRKLHKGKVEKMSRNDLEELIVQKLCEAITERSEVGEMRLRCQALERGQEKWKDKYSQLQKQVRELNIVLKKFRSEQEVALKEKSIPPTPVRITRSVGLQVTFPGTGQRSLAALRMRQQKEAAVASSAANATSAASPATAAASTSNSSPALSSVSNTASVASTANATNIANLNTAQNSGPTGNAFVQSPARRPQETTTQTPITTPPQRQGNSVPPASTVLTVNTTLPRAISTSQSTTLTLSRPQMPTQVQPSMQPAQRNPGNTVLTLMPGVVNQMANLRPRGNSIVNVRAQSQTHHQVVHQVQQRQQALQSNQQTSVSQVVVSTSSTPQIGRLQVVLAPQQQQQLLQQQQIVLRQQQTSTKDVEVIDLDREDRGRQTTRVQQIQQVNNTSTFSANGNMTVRLLPNPQQSGVQQSHMTLLVPATATTQQQKMIITSSPSTVQLNSNQGKSRTNVLLKGVVQAVNAQGSSGVRQSGVVQQGTIINSSGLTIVQQPQQAQQQMPQLQQLRPIRVPSTHPAPLPAPPIVQPENPSWKMSPPRPSLKIQHTDNGIVLSWNMNLRSTYEEIDSYQLYAYQEGTSPPSSSLWKKVGDVKALPLPMACTLTQFAEGHRYHFAVRAVDIRNRIGPFSAPGNIRLEQRAQ